MSVRACRPAARLPVPYVVDDVIVAVAGVFVDRSPVDMVNR
jgi:hypothetical protein